MPGLEFRLLIDKLVTFLGTEQACMSIDADVQCKEIFMVVVLHTAL